MKKYIFITALITMSLLEIQATVTIKNNAACSYFVTINCFNCDGPDTRRKVVVLCPGQKTSYQTAGPKYNYSINVEKITVAAKSIASETCTNTESSNYVIDHAGTYCISNGCILSKC